LGGIKLLALGTEQSSDEQIDLFFQQLDLLSLPLFVAFKLPDSLVFLSKELLESNLIAFLARAMSACLACSS